MYMDKSRKQIWSKHESEKVTRRDKQRNLHKCWAEKKRELKWNKMDKSVPPACAAKGLGAPPRLDFCVWRPAEHEQSEREVMMCAVWIDGPGIYLYNPSGGTLSKGLAEALLALSHCTLAFATSRDPVQTETVMLCRLQKGKLRLNVI